MKNQVSLKVSPSEFELKCSTRTGYSMSLGSKKEEPNLLLVLYDLMAAMAAINENRGFRYDPAITIERYGWKFQTVSDNGLLINNSTQPLNWMDSFRIGLRQSKQIIIHGGVNFAGGQFVIDDPDCYHIWTATFFPLNDPKQPVRLKEIDNYWEGVTVADDGVIPPLDS